MFTRRALLQSAAGSAGLALLPFLNQMQARADGKADAAAEAKAVPPLKALMICGGPPNIDYATQKTILSEGISQRANVTWTIVHESPKANIQKHKNSAYASDDWAEGYDVIFHHEHYGFIEDEAFVERIVKPHRDGKVPAVFTPSSMLSYRRAANRDEWCKIMGVRTGHTAAEFEVTVKNLKPDHPVMAGFGESWLASKDQFYNIKGKLYPTVTPLGAGSRRDGKRKIPCIWVNEFDGYRAFVTTFGLKNETMRDAKYLDLMTRGLLWACGKLNDDGTPKAGYGPATGEETDNNPTKPQGE